VSAREKAVAVREEQQRARELVEQEQHKLRDRQERVERDLNAIVNF
jgi:hypothetical protein